MDTTGTECVRALMTTSRHLIELFIQVFGELQFFLVFGVATSISFLLSKRSQPYIISSNKPSYGAAITLQFVWSDRNRRLFDQRSANPKISALFAIYTTFSAHNCYFRRQARSRRARSAFENT
ncbi:unnamed protein product [Albugo candida]|uniref:Uncharacterized protein n=1 Tax=Albugo candida TaxID=65357 RepID=A0A024FW58_9STRA|nr:unnamed protein product [Albugo candida]|eukprot:CCI11142.1 unnamed protein product [Albugo candida]